MTRLGRVEWVSAASRLLTSMPHALSTVDMPCSLSMPHCSQNRRPSNRVLWPFKSQKLRHLTQVVDSPESFRLTRCVRANEPWQAERAVVNGLIRVLEQQLLPLGSSSENHYCSRVAEADTVLASCLELVCLSAVTNVRWSFMWFVRDLVRLIKNRSFVTCLPFHDCDIS